MIILVGLPKNVSMLTCIAILPNGFWSSASKLKIIGEVGI